MQAEKTFEDVALELRSQFYTKFTIIASLSEVTIALEKLKGWQYIRKRDVIDKISNFIFSYGKIDRKLTSKQQRNIYRLLDIQEEEFLDRPFIASPKIIYKSIETDKETPVTTNNNHNKLLISNSSGNVKLGKLEPTDLIIPILNDLLLELNVYFYSGISVPIAKFYTQIEMLQADNYDVVRELKFVIESKYRWNWDNTKGVRGFYCEIEKDSLQKDVRNIYEKFV